MISGGIKMKCPYCNSEMVHGFINRPMETFSFYPSNVKPKIFRSKWSINKDAVLIKKFKQWEFSDNTYKYPADYCEKCQKIILEVSSNIEI
jgi:hypothetical protein